MWLITTTGFFSIVEKPWDRAPGTLTVRARARQDLEALKAGSLPELGDITEAADADYRYRAQAPREAVVRAVAFGAVAERMRQQAVGSSWRFAGFVTNPRAGKGLVLHVQEFQPVSTDSSGAHHGRT